MFGIFFMLTGIADAVLFHIRTWVYIQVGPFKIRDVPKIRSPNQLYVFLLNEPPHFTFTDLKTVPPGFFNISATYRLDSDVQYTYDEFQKIEPDTPPSEIYSWEEVKKAVSRKNSSILQLTSDCDTPSQREVYVKELSKHIDVTQFGRCFGKKCDRECEEKNAAYHHFVLAFENRLCTDYVSEKFFRLKRFLIVPIVMKNDLYKNIAPPNSYIAADNFSSPEHLARYLKYLEDNHEAYLKYFEWTKTYKKVKRESIICRLCETLYEKRRQKKIIENIQKWWHDDAKCYDDYGKFLSNKTSLAKVTKKEIRFLSTFGHILYLLHTYMIL